MLLSKNSEKKGRNRNKRRAASTLNPEMSTKALKRARFEESFPEERGKRAFNKPFSQKKLTAPARKTKVSYSPIAFWLRAVLVNTIPVTTRVAYLAS